MMNLLALSLVATSLAVAGLWSPSPAKTTSNGDSNIIVKEGHRVVVIEYDKDGHENTKVMISPEHDTNVIRKPESVSIAEDKIASNAKDKAKEVASGLPRKPESVSIAEDKFASTVEHAKEKAKEAVNGDRHGAKEIICDAFGKCREKIAGAVGRGWEKVEEEVQGVKEGAREGKDAVEEAYGKAKDTAGEAFEKARESVKDAKDTVETVGDDLVQNASRKAEMAGENVAQKAKDAKESVRGVAVKAKNTARKVTEMMSKPLRVMSSLPTETLSSVMNVVNLLGSATAYGMCIWVTFVSSNVLAAALPRQQFGMVQSKVYPVYFRAMAFSVGMALLGHALGHRKQLASSDAERFQGYNLLVSLLAVLVNSVYLEPRATKVMFERVKIEKEEGRGIGATISAGETERGTRTVPTTTAAASDRLEQKVIRTRIMKLSQRLKKLNTYSSFVNILTLVGLAWHLMYLGQRLHMTC